LARASKLATLSQRTDEHDSHDRIKNAMNFLDLLFRLIHIFTAVALVGGTIYVRFVLLPAAKELPDAEHDALKGRLKASWKKWVMIGITLLLVSGFYNYLQVAAPAHKAVGDSRYHMFMGIKILLALGVFFLASVMTGRSAKFEGMRKNPAGPLSILILLAAITIGLGSFLKVRGIPSGATPATSSDTGSESDGD